MDVRNADAGEAAHLARLWHDGWRDAHAAIVPASFARLRTPGSFAGRMQAALPRVRVVGPPGAPVGFYYLTGEKLDQLYVAAEARGTGVAAALIDDAEAVLAARGVETAWLACVIGNERAARFYEKHGWRRVGTTVTHAETDQGPLALEVWRYEKVVRRAAPPGAVTVRDLDEADIPAVMDYWFRSPPAFLESMGVDLARMPQEGPFEESLRKRIREAAAADVSKLNTLAILLDGRPVGMHTINPLVEGDHGIFHAHLWSAESRGRGIALRSYPLACRLFLRRFDLMRILFKTPARNTGAIRVKEKLGIRFVGDELVDFGVIRAGTPAKVFELTREEAEALWPDLP